MQTMIMSLPSWIPDAPAQRKESGDDGERESTVLSSAGSGNAMPADVQAKMELAQSADFIGALAYTQGNDIRFAPGQYDPGSECGRELLGDALTHVVQRSQGGVNAAKQAKGLGVKAYNSAASPVQMRAHQINRAPAADKSTSGRGGARAKGRSASDFASLEAIVNDIAGNVKKGGFADANFKLGIPVPEVPGLAIKISVSGSFAVDHKGEKKASLSLGVGVEYSLGKLFKVMADHNDAISLKGVDLGAALVDCVKQSAYWAMEKAGIHARFAELVRLAKQGPSFWDRATLLIPYYGTYQTARLAIAEFGADKLEAAHAALTRFFKNDADVGFEVSMGLGGGGGLSNKAAYGRFEARAGLEDVKGKKTRGFTELAGEVGGILGNNSVKVRYARRFREGGQPINIIDIQSVLSMPKKAFQPAGGESLVRNGEFLWNVFSVARNLATAEEGGTANDVMNLVSAVLKLGSEVFGNTKKFDNVGGLDVKVSESGGHWTVDNARVKLMTQFGTGTGVSVGGIEANVKVGTFLDVTGVLAKGLAVLGVS
jgi:Domain of unknown function (DUF4157)